MSIKSNKEKKKEKKKDNFFSTIFLMQLKVKLGNHYLMVKKNIIEKSSCP